MLLGLAFLAAAALKFYVIYFGEGLLALPALAAWLELGLGVCILSRLKSVAPSIAGVFALVTFAIYLGVRELIQPGWASSCACLGPVKLDLHQHLALLVLLLGASTFSIAIDRPAPTPRGS